jgi:hypothetical protein
MKQTFVLTTAVVFLAVAVPLGILINAQVRKESSGRGEGWSGDGIEAQAVDYRVSGPYTHKNLAIFLIHGKNLVEGKTFLTLQEALEQKKVIVYETKDVNELAIELPQSAG